mmetsp:Transcript_170674/g.547459  ORF Transcript_170674/g.547459 Transcript_170674/m.547459 type:complete len:208 (+) Transcript_170674:7032-7655(+)
MIPLAEADVNLLNRGPASIHRVLVEVTAIRHREAIAVLGPHFEENLATEELRGFVPTLVIPGGRCGDLRVPPIQGFEDFGPIAGEQVDEAGHQGEVEVHGALGLFVARRATGPEVNHRRGATAGHGRVHWQHRGEAHARLHGLRIIHPDFTDLSDVGLARLGRPTDAVASALRRGVTIPHSEVVEPLLAVAVPSDAWRVVDGRELRR